MIHVRTNTEIGAVAALSLLAALVALIARAVYATLMLLPWLYSVCSPRALFGVALRAIKSAALWLNAARYKVTEEEIAHLHHFQKRLYQLARDNGQDAGYYARFRLKLSAKEYRQRLLQRKLQARRDRINQW